MSKEQLQPTEPFAFTENEKLWERISHERLKALLDDEQTTIHSAELTSNMYGEFIFITVSRPEQEKQQAWTMYGMGYHEYRDRWFTEEWAFYRAQPFPETLERRMEREEVEELLRTRQEEITPYAATASQSARGKLFEMLAELTDDDGAISEMDDLGDLWDDLADGLE